MSIEQRVLEDSATPAEEEQDAGASIELKTIPEKTTNKLTMHSGGVTFSDENKQDKDWEHSGRTRAPTMHRNVPLMKIRQQEKDDAFERMKSDLEQDLVLTLLKKFWRVNSGFFTAVMVVLTWVTMGALFYHLHLDWPYTTSLYYAAQAGLSVGFGAIIEPTDVSRLFTVFFVLMGSSFIAGALGLFVTVMLEKHDIKTELKKLEMKKKVASGEVDAHDSWYLASDWYWYYKENKTKFNCAIAFVVWIMMGTLYGMIGEEWQFIRSLYFAVTALSTGGLQAPTAPLGKETWGMFFCFFFVLTGVPVYGLALGQLAGIFVDKYESKKMEEKIKSTISQSEYEYAMKLNDGAEGGDADFEIDYCEFIQFSLIRLGVCDRDTLDQIKAQFEDLDVDGNGSFTRLEMHGALTFDKFDKDGSQAIDMSEFIQLAEEMEIEATVSAIQDAFNDIDTDGSGSIARREFVNWYFEVKNPKRTATDVMNTDGSIDINHRLRRKHRARLSVVQGVPISEVKINAAIEEASIATHKELTAGVEEQEFPPEATVALHTAQLTEHTNSETEEPTEAKTSTADVQLTFSKSVDDETA